MALNKKKSRPITVADTKFRWVISPNSGFIVFVAEKESVKARKIEVYIQSDIDSFWGEFPYTDGLNLKVIKPNDAEFIIKQAISLGWNPDEKGKPIVFDLENKELIKR